MPIQAGLPSTARSRPEPFRQGAVLALPLLFTLLGLVFATWASRIPAMRDALQLSAGQLGFALLCAGIGGLASFPLAAWLVARHGQARAAFAGGLALLLALPCIGWSTQSAALMAALGLLGAAASCFDVAINAIGAAAEKRAGRSIMSLLHAWFCVGTLLGALGGSVMASFDVSPRWHFSVLAAVMVLPLWAACRSLNAPLPVRDAASATRGFGLPPRPLLVLGLLGFCGAIAEGGIADWSGVFMQDHIGAAAGVAPLAYAGFSGAMLLLRLVNDRFKDRWGARRVVAVGGVIAALGIGLALAGWHAGTTIAGFALAGAGLAGVFPFVFSAAGRHGSTALAGVATISYCGALVGPPFIGFIAQSAGLTLALAVLGVLCAVMALAALRAVSLD
ncbi:MAG: MFS transporter [Herminiimonas sp.]|nr:MFS transporter [Herminiimonas sp.]